MASRSDELGYHGKLPPQNLEAEMGVLGSIMLTADLVQVLDEIGELSADQFYADRHQKVFAAILSLRDDGLKTIDAVMVAEALERTQQLAEIGGVEYLAKILETVPNAAHAGYYAGIVRDRWQQRQMVYFCSETLDQVYSGSMSSEEVAAIAERKLTSIAEAGHQSHDVSIGDVLVEAWASISTRLGKHEAAGTPTGFADLDQLIVGIQGAELVIIAARPSMGKTALAGGLMLALARAGIGTLFLSLEMSRLEISERFLCCDSGVSSTKLKAGGPFDEWELDALMQSAGRVGQLAIRIDDQPGQKVRQIAATARRAKRLHDIGFIVIDYLQLVEPNETKDVREQEVAGITKALKGLAKELNIPVIVLAQLNRGVESREDKRPRLGDLRESGAIEQDADKVIFLHRPAAYDPLDRPGECDLIVAKNRCGRIGTVTLAWLADTTQFKDLASKQFAAGEAASRAFAPNREHEPKRKKDWDADDDGPRSAAPKSTTFGNRDR